MCPYYWMMRNCRNQSCPIYRAWMFNNKDSRYCFRKNTSLRSFTTEEAQEIGEKLNIKFDKFDVEQFRIGLQVELEHGTINGFTNVTDDDPILTGKIALAHLNEFPDYYKRLTDMEEEADKYWEKD